MRGRALSVVLTVLVSVLTVLTGSGAAAPSTHQPSSIAWGACESPILQQFGAECGFVTVPLDYDDPHGQQIRLAVSRITHTAEPYQGVMLVNPGGPGGSGLDLAYLGQFVPNGAGLTYDWIGFDPRGVGSSEPSLSCDPSYIGPDRPDYTPTTPEIEQAWLTRVQAYAAACAKAGGALLDNMTTEDAARDLDEIRKALGVAQINYYGFSYGTYLAQVYTSLFPDRMRRMVLDGVVDPGRVWWEANLDQDVAFERNLGIFFEWVARYDSVFHLGTTQDQVEQRWYAEQEGLRQAPAGGVVGPSEWADIFLYAGYAEFLWEPLADTFRAWAVERDTAALVQAYEDFVGPGQDNGYAVYLAVQCTDAAWPENWQRWRATNDRVAREAPFLTWSNAWFNAPCAFWPAESGKPVHITGRGVGSALLISQTLDAATPYSGALRVRQLFKEAVLVAEPGGTTHSGSLSGNPCTDQIIAEYLATGALPERQRGNRADVLCTPLPQPVPSGADEVQAPAYPEKVKGPRGRLPAVLATLG